MLRRGRPQQQCSRSRPRLIRRSKTSKPPPKEEQMVAAIAAIASRSPRARRVKAAKAAALLVAHGNRAGAMTKEALLRRCMKISMKMALARLANAEPLLKKTQTSMQRDSDEWSIFRNDQRSGGAQFVTLMTGPQVDPATGSNDGGQRAHEAFEPSSLGSVGCASGLSCLCRQDPPGYLLAGGAGDSGDHKGHVPPRR